MLIPNNKTIFYRNSYVINSTSCKYMLCKVYIIVLTLSSYAINYINVRNDLCLCIKRLYTFPYLNNVTPYYISNADGKRGLTFYLLIKSNKILFTNLNNKCKKQIESIKQITN